MHETHSNSAETPPEPDLSGQKLGDYQLLHRLGRGGMADVYLAEQNSLRRQVAFKVLKRALASDELYVRRFHNEAQAAAALVQANIVQIYEVGCIDGIHFIVQEYVAGQNLHQLLTRSGPVDIKLAVNIMRQVATGLYKAGQQGIVHRDIKPENIMLATSGEVKVADFGLARITGNGDKVNLTQVGVTMGTPLYMSPEQVEGGSLDPRSDIYSFGVTCYQMLAGRLPFEGETALSIAVQHLKSEPDLLTDLRPDVPDGLCRIIHKMLAKDPADRYQHSAELLTDLRALPIEGAEDEWPSTIDEWSTPELLALADGRAEATRQLDVAMKTEADQLRLRRRGWLVAAMFALAAFALGGALAWQFPPQDLLNTDDQQRPAIQQMQTAQEQYNVAMFTEDDRAEEALQAVWTYFPPEQNPENEYYAWRAKERLAELYLRRDNLTGSMEIFDELASLSALEEQFRVFGWAGQAIVLDRRDQRDEAATKLARVMPLQQHLNQYMSNLVQDIADRYEQRDSGS